MLFLLYPQNGGASLRRCAPTLAPILVSCQQLPSERRLRYVNLRLPCLINKTPPVLLAPRPPPASRERPPRCVREHPSKWFAKEPYFAQARRHPQKVTAALEQDLGLRICRLPFGSVVQNALGQKWTRDPFDRLIVANAKASGARLITKEERIRRHYSFAIW